MWTPHLLSLQYCSVSSSMEAVSTSGAPYDFGLSSHNTSDSVRTWTLTSSVKGRKSQEAVRQGRGG